MIQPESPDSLIAAITAFLAQHGITVEEAALPADTFLPGLSPHGTTLVVDRSRLLYPGDLLHEAGHIACAEPERRMTIDGHAGDDPAEEMMAIAWSYAAAMAIGIDPKIVFHEHGYRGGGASIAENFETGRTIGVPMLQWLEMACEPREAERRGVEPFPAMMRWLR